MKIIRS